MDISLKCSCGNVQGVARGISANTGTRIVCYCNDCQAFAKHLKREDDILDANGGTDIFQMTPAQIQFQSGSEHLKCIRLTEKGLQRWYTECCNTPIGNTVSAGLPFVGLIHNIMECDTRDEALGPVRGYVNRKAAIGKLPNAATQSRSMGIIFRSIRKMLLAKLTGKSKPNPFFDAKGKPVSEPTVLF